ncbi:MAG TPA: methyltransferase domain-containing protein [Clostridia bacterium]|nr:methyltransferase domain-containing protein [Clostridia bacterium]
MNRILVFTATYNEVDNIASLLDAIFAALPACDVLVVDDNSPDKTGELLEQIRAHEPRLHVVHRPAKNGLGTAHKLAVKYALAEKYDALITMDADFSHDPSYLPEMVRQLEQAEFVIGSRYVEGGSCEYPLSRVLLSRVANSLARVVLGIPVHETTTSYRGFRRSLLQRMNIDAIRADGYSYFVESIYQVGRIARADNTPRAMAEFPIRFADRRAGTTKISKKEIWKGFSTLFRLGVQRAVFSGKVPPEAVPAPLPSERLVACNACGSGFQVEEYPASNSGHAVSTYSCTSTGHESHGRIVQCLSCGLVYTNPQLTSLNVLSFYSQVEDKTYVENLEAREATFAYNLDAIAALLPKGGRMLDVGSYCGVFLKIARERGYEVLGVEPSVWASSYARETLQIPTITGSIDGLPADTKPFDVVCSWDVLEHVADPSAQLKQINKCLVPGGIHAFSTLDYGNWYPRLLGERWPWMMDMHIYYFDQRVMRQMLTAAGFRIVRHQPYSHIITVAYFLQKLAALGVPGSDAAGTLLALTPLSKLQIRFHFGDIQLYVCEKIAEPVSSADTRLGVAGTRQSA